MAAVHRLRSQTGPSGLLVAIFACIGSCSSPGPTVEPTGPQDRGCSDWPSRAGETFVSVDGASRFEVEPFWLVAGDDTLVSWEAYGCDDVTRVAYARRTSTGFETPRYLSSPGGQMASNATFARDAAGALYAAWASWTPGPDCQQPHVGVTDIRIQLARQPAGASDFASPVELSEPVADQLYDKPWMTILADVAMNP